jgi:hypothetical protein
VFIAPVVWLPLAALVPVHEPPAVQELGLFVTDHVIVALLPVFIEAGLTEIVTTGTAITVSVAEADPLPALFVQLRAYTKLPAVASTPVLALPLPLLLPDQALLAVHEVGLLVADQVIVELLPVPIDAGLTEIETTGATTPPPLAETPTVVVALPLPPALLQLRV